MKKIMIIAALLCFSFGCTPQQRAKNFGGKTEVSIPADKKLIIATWKEANLWLLVRDRKEGEVPETYTFSESSSWGVWQGTITIRER